MKKIALLLAMIACLAVLSASADADKNIDITFDFSRMSTMASNQFAVWIEDQDGNVVRTLFVTDFTAGRRGYEKRDMCLPAWVAAANPSEMSDEQLDAVSGATPAAGAQRFVWDLKDQEGNPVPAVTYTVKVEGSLYWESSVLYSASIEVGGDITAEID